MNHEMHLNYMDDDTCHWWCNCGAEGGPYESDKEAEDSYEFHIECQMRRDAEDGLNFIP